jgi:predicted extracellular nuclease
VLDDGASVNFLGAGENTALPYLTGQREIRVGGPATLTAPVVLEFRVSKWRFQPTSQVTAADAGPATFGHTRTDAPQPTGGNLHLASFNVLNYFPTTGADFVAAGGKCTWYDDRARQHVTVNTCTGPAGEPGPRGAAEDDDHARQQAKIVTAVNGLGADVVSLEEIENSTQFGPDRDAAVRRLVGALNDAAGAGTWDFVPSPPSAADQSGEDVIRTAFIYKPAAVRPVGDSVIDDVPVFDVARDPLAQAFRPVGGSSYSTFVMIVNHFKSKGSGPDDDTGQGSSNPQRVQQALELKSFANDMKAHYGTDKVFLSGDFNAYTKEDPMAELYRAGYTDIGSAQAPEEHTYLFDGTVGSLDHVLGNAAATKLVTGAHVWNINSVESVALEYSRFNYNLTDFFAPDQFRASDHDPLVVGLALPQGAVPTTTTASVSPDPLPFRSEDGQVHVRVGSEYGTVQGGVVEVRENGARLGRAEIRDGQATMNLPAYTKKGAHSLVVTYLGTEDAAGSQTTAGFTVAK